MNHAAVSAILDQALTDQQIRDDLTGVLQSCSQDGVTLIGLGEVSTPVPLDAHLEIVTKAFFKEYHPGVGFGAYKVLVAIGGFLHKAGGNHQAKHCFALLFYNDDAQMITLDFRRDFI